MIVKLYKNMKVISCTKCGYSRKEKIANTTNNNLNNTENLVPPEEHEEYFDGIDILNKLDEQNENS